VAWAIDVRVVTLGRLVLDVAHGNRDDLRVIANRAALGDIGIRDFLAAIGLGHDLADCCCQRGLAVIDVTDRADVDVGLVTVEFLFGHLVSPCVVSVTACQSRHAVMSWGLLEPRMRIELTTSPPYQGGALPLSYLGVSRR
jgi:hypothetical protein